jgi:hypothetical protein
VGTILSTHTANEVLVRIRYIYFLFGISFTLKPNKKLFPALLSTPGLSQNLYVSHLFELSAQLQERRRGQGTAANPCLAAVPYPSLCSLLLSQKFSHAIQENTIEIPN